MKINMKYKIATLLVVLFLTSSSIYYVAYADFGKSHILEGRFKGSNNESYYIVPYWMHSSVLDSKYNDVYRDSVFNAVSEWGKVSTNLSFTRHTSLQSSTKLKIYVEEYFLPQGVPGAAFFFERDSSGNLTHLYTSDVINGSNFDVVEVILDHGRMSGDLLTRSHSTNEKYHNTAHEIGHSLSLNEFNNSPGHSGSHFMRQGRISLTTPSSEDISHLRQKWGH